MKPARAPSPDPSTVPPVSAWTPPIPASMIGVDDGQAGAECIALALLSSEDKRELWQRLVRDFPSLAAGIKELAQAFNGQAVRLDLRGHDQALHEHYRARAGSLPET